MEVSEAVECRRNEVVFAADIGELNRDGHRAERTTAERPAYIHKRRNQRELSKIILFIGLTGAIFILHIPFLKQIGAIMPSMFKSGELSSIPIETAGKLASERLTTERLKKEFEEGRIRRKAFCEFLDIGESTLSTWLQSGRIPQAAAVAYVLFGVVRDLSAELQARDEAEKETLVVREKDGFALVAPAESEGEPRRIVRSIDNFDEAVAEAAWRSPLLARRLDNVQDILSERAEEEGDFFDEAANDVEEVRLLLSDPKAWRRTYRPTWDELAEKIGDDNA